MTPLSELTVLRSQGPTGNPASPARSAAASATLSLSSSRAGTAACSSSASSLAAGGSRKGLPLCACSHAPSRAKSSICCEQKANKANKAGRENSQSSRTLTVGHGVGPPKPVDRWSRGGSPPCFFLSGGRVCLFRPGTPPRKQIAYTGPPLSCAPTRPGF